jgi:hypothetical protein
MAKGAKKETKPKVDKKTKAIKKEPKLAKEESKKPDPVIAPPATSKKAALTKASKGGISKASTKEGSSNQKSLDLLLLLDCTGSMSSWIQRSKDTLKEIIDAVKSSNPSL